MKYYLFMIALLYAVSSFAQETGSIIMTKNFWGTRFSQDGRFMRPGQVLHIMSTNEEAYAVFKKAKTNYDVSMVLGYVGGFLVGWPIGTALGGGDPQWGMAIAGGGLILLSIPLTSAFNKHAERAVSIYNGGSDTARGVKVNVVPYGFGARVVMRF